MYRYKVTFNSLYDTEEFSADSYEKDGTWVTFYRNQEVQSMIRESRVERIDLLTQSA